MARASARIQRNAVAAIAGTNDSWVEYDWEPRRPFERFALPPAANPLAKCWVPKWLIDPVGVDYFHHVTSVTFCNYSSGRPVSEAVLSHIAKLRNSSDSTRPVEGDG